MMSDTDLVAQTLALPSGYATARLGMSLHPTHAAVLDTLFTPGPPTVLRSANGCGKTATVCTAAVLYAIEILGAQVISTSGSWRQVTEQLCPNLRRFAHLYPSWDFQDHSIEVGGENRYLGFSADNEGVAQGFHASPEVPLLVIVDESAAIKDAIFDALEDRVAPTWMLITGSPLSPEGRFYAIETTLAKHYRHFKLSKQECTTDKGYWIDPESIQRMLDKWGPEHPLVLSSIFAEFALNIEGAILTLSELERCIEKPPAEKGDKRHVFLDFAAGGDENVVAVCVGNQAWIEDAWTDKDTMRASRKFVDILNELKMRIGLKASEVDGDADGLGTPMVQRIQELGWKINAFHGGSDPRFDPEYKNLIAEVWGEGARKIKRCEVHLMDGDDMILKGQLLNRKTKFNSSGLLELENKKDMAARGVESPDRADALLGAIHPNSAAPPKVYVPPAPPLPCSSF